MAPFFRFRDRTSFYILLRKALITSPVCHVSSLVLPGLRKHISRITLKTEDSPMQSTRLTRVLLAVCLTAAALSACGGNDDGPASPSNPSNPGNPSNPSQPVEKRCAP